MNDYDRAGSWRDFSLDVSWIHVVGVIDIGEDWNGILIEYGDNCPEVSYRRRNDFVAGIEIQSSQCDVNSGGSRSRGHTIRHAVGICEFFLEGRDHLAADTAQILRD